MAKSSELRGVFCIETPVWFGDTDKRSMRPMLQWLHDVYGTPFLYRDAISLEEFYRYLGMWGEMKCGPAGEDEQYPILILAYHGDIDGIWVTDQQPGEIETEDEDESPLVQLQDIAEFLDGRCKNKVVHFASCSTISVSNSTIGEFLETTGASAVSGYAEEVDWTWSMAFDLLYLQAIQEAPYKYLSPKLMKEKVSDYLKDAYWVEPYPYDVVRKRLGFDIRERSKPA